VTHRDANVRAFTQQSESFGGAAVTRMPETLDMLLGLAAPAAGERWLDAACGPGVVSRALAPLVGEVLGVDATPAMVEVARREAAADGAGNARFAVGDAERLDLPDGAFDGALCRFALHHLAVPGRALGELRRVVRPGGVVVVADHLADDDADAMAWAQTVERLRDPSHWCSLTREGLRRMGAQAGMELEREQVVAVSLDYPDWLARGPGATEHAAAIAAAFAERPAGTDCFRRGGDTLTLQVWMGRWRR
jgi:SAM-dependent methyltransferase